MSRRALGTTIVAGASLAFTFFTQGCTTSEGEESLGSVEQRFGASACSTVAADTTFTGRVHFGNSGGGTAPELVTGLSYDNCFRGYVVDINDLGCCTGSGGSSGGGSMPPLPPPTRIQLRWASTVPPTKLACEAAWAGAVFYKKVAGAWVAQGDEVDAYGSWSGTCTTPSLTSTSVVTLTPGESYRVAATMRKDYGSSVLKAIGISTPP